MVAEGLDCMVEFRTLLTVIHISFSKLGRRAEMAKDDGSGIIIKFMCQISDQ